MTSPFVSRAGAAALAGACVLLVSSRIPSAQTRAPETITTDFLAIGGDGRPVRDLKPDDLTLRVDGKTRTIRSLQLVPIGDAPGSGIKVSAAATPAPYDTNVLSRTGRAIMVVIDDESIPVGGERSIKDLIGQMAAELATTDRIAIATVPHGTLKLDFTADRGRLQQALAPIVGQPKPASSDQDAACQTKLVLQQTAALLDGIDPAMGPTTFILLTGGLVGPRSDTFGGTTGQRVGSGSIGICELTTDHFQQVAQATATARAQFYLVQPERDLGALGSSSTALFGGNVNPQVGLEHLAGVTGTQVMKISTTGGNVLSRVTRETSAHYLVMFDADPADRRPGNHRMELKTGRADVTVRARTVLGAAAAAAAGTAATPRDTLRDGKPYRDLPMRAAAFVSRTADQKVLIVATVEPLDPGAKLSAVSAGLYSGNRLVSEWSAKPEDLVKVPVRAGIAAPPGQYRLRVAARDLNGKLGAVDENVTADLTAAGPLKLSSLVLGTQPAGGGFAQKLEFAGDPAVTVYFELYGGRTNMQLGAAVELAASADGPTLATAQPKWSGSTEPDKFIATAQIPIDTLAPGDYVVRAIVAVEGQPEGRIYRTLRKR